MLPELYLAYEYKCLEYVSPLNSRERDNISYFFCLKKKRIFSPEKWQRELHELLFDPDNIRIYHYTKKITLDKIFIRSRIDLTLLNADSVSQTPIN